MTSSLVGSEMCIRDRILSALRRTGRPLLNKGGNSSRPEFLGCASPVSYTHLTLPTSVDLGGR
eukprot:2001937-Prorocentrum_lima.AAC.1